MAIGIKHGRTSAEQSPQTAWAQIDEYLAAFKDKFGAMNCRQLTGLNVKTEEGMKEYLARVHDYECTKRVRFAVEKGIEILSK